MGAPHPALFELVAGRPLPAVTGDAHLALATSAAEHRLAPLLLSRLQAEGRDLDSPARRVLTFEDMANRAHLQHLAAVRRQVFDEAAKIVARVALFKGETTAARWWENPELRCTTDIDLFLCPADLSRLGDLVLALDPTYPNAALLDGFGRRGTLQWVSFVVDTVAIDLHLDPMNTLARSRQLDQFWDRRVILTLADGAEVPALDATTAVVHWAVNQVRDGFPYLSGLVDLRGALADTSVEWDQVIGVAAAEGWEALVVEAVRYGCATLGVPCPVPPLRRSAAHRALDILIPHRARWQACESAARARTSQWAVQLVPRGRTRESIRQFGRRLILPSDLLDRHADLRGPYLWRLARHRRRNFSRRTRRLAADD